MSLTSLRSGALGVEERVRSLVTLEAGMEAYAAVNVCRSDVNRTDTISSTETVPSDQRRPATTVTEEERIQILELPCSVGDSVVVLYILKKC